MGSEGWLEAGRPADEVRYSARTGGSACLRLVTASAEETQRVGEVLGKLLRPADLILLQGPLGAGKTCFTQGLARGFGFEGRVTSPSFTLANVYEPAEGGCPLYHLDLWRIKNPVEALGLGLDEYLSGNGPCVIEWPEVAEAVLPNGYLLVRIEPLGESRRFEICAIGEGPEKLLDQLRASLPGKVGSGGAIAARD